MAQYTQIFTGLCFESHLIQSYTFILMKSNSIAEHFFVVGRSLTQDPSV